MRVADVDLQFGVAARGLEPRPQLLRQLVRRRRGRARGAAGEIHLDHDLRLDVAPGVGGRGEGHGDDGLVGEEFDLEGAAEGFRVGGVELVELVEGVDVVGVGEVLGRDAVEAVLLLFLADGEVEVEAELGEQNVPWYVVLDLGKGRFEVREGLDEFGECLDGARVANVQEGYCAAVGDVVVNVAQ